jgi:hypothetical protein
MAATAASTGRMVPTPVIGCVAIALGISWMAGTIRGAGSGGRGWVAGAGGLLLEAGGGAAGAPGAGGIGTTRATGAITAVGAGGGDVGTGLAMEPGTGDGET